MSFKINLLTGGMDEIGVPRIVKNRAPTSADYQFPQGTEWADDLNDDIWFLAGKTGTVASWEKVVGGSTGVAQIDGDTGSATPVGGIINIIGDSPQGLTSSCTGNTETFTISDSTTSQKGTIETALNSEAITATALDKALVPGNMTSLFAEPPAIGGTTPNTGKFTYLDLVGGAAPVHSAGRVYYDSTTDTLNFYNAETEVALNIGEENWIKVRNETGVTVTNGQIVYLNGSGSGFPLIEKALATSETASMVIGVVTHDIENNSTGYVTTFGLVRNVNTASFSGGDVIYLSSTVAGAVTITKPDAKTNFVVRIGVVGAVDASVGTFHVDICCGGSLSDINSYTFNMNGFDDPDNEVSISFVNGTRTLEIAPQVSTFTYWSEGVAYLKSSAEDIIIPDTEGPHFIYYNGGTLTSSTSWSLDYILKYSFVAAIYWDAANNEQIYLGDEFQHTTDMPGKTHQYLHDTRGFSLESGAGLTDILTDQSGDLASHAEFGNEATIVYDEDAEFNHSARTSTSNIPVYYKTNTEASPFWRVAETASFGVLTTGTGRAAYNQLTGGNWVQTEVSNNDFVLSHVFTFNDSTRRYGIVQGESSYLTRGDARDAAYTEINDITLDGLIGPEVKFIGTIIYQTNDGYGNTVKSRIRSTDTGDEYVDLRDFSFTRGGVSGTLTDHGALTGLGDNDHPQYLLVDGSAPMTGTFIELQGSDVASANDMTLGLGNLFDITGTTTINTIVTKGIGTSITLQFDGILQLTHSADLVMPTAANVTTAAGDIAVFYEYASGDWRCSSYTRTDGTPLGITFDAYDFVVTTGNVTQRPGSATYFVGKWGNDAADGLTYSSAKLTIQAAISAASEGAIVVVYPGTYTENITLANNVSVVAFNADRTTPEIIGKLSCNLSSGKFAIISDMKITTNGDYAVSLTGTNINYLTLKDCVISGSDNDIVEYTNSNASSILKFSQCTIDPAGAYLPFASSSAGFLILDYCLTGNAGGSTTAATISAGVLRIGFSEIRWPITTSGTSLIEVRNSFFRLETLNATALTIGGSGSGCINNSIFKTGTASSISISSEATVSGCDISSSNTNPITGAGTLNYSAISYSNTGIETNTTTQAGNYVDLGASRARSQPAFEASVSGALNTVTGDGTSYQIIFGTEAGDQAGSYNNATGVVTAGPAGYYLFTFAIQTDGYTADHDEISLDFVRSVGSNPRVALLYDATGQERENRNINGSMVLKLAAAETVHIAFLVNGAGGTKVINITAGTFSGVQIC